MYTTFCLSVPLGWTLGLLSQFSCCGMLLTDTCIDLSWRPHFQCFPLYPEVVWLTHTTGFIYFLRAQARPQAALLFRWWTSFFSFRVRGLDNSLRGPWSSSLTLHRPTGVDTPPPVLVQGWYLSAHSIAALSPCLVSALEEFISFLFQAQPYSKPFLNEFFALDYLIFLCILSRSGVCFNSVCYEPYSSLYCSAQTLMTDWLTDWLQEQKWMNVSLAQTDGTRVPVRDASYLFRGTGASRICFPRRT